MLVLPVALWLRAVAGLAPRRTEVKGPFGTALAGSGTTTVARLWRILKSWLLRLLLSPIHFMSRFPKRLLLQCSYSTRDEEPEPSGAAPKRA